LNKEITQAQGYLKSLGTTEQYLQPGRFQQASSALSKMSQFDIETAGLKATDAVYEYGIAHGLDQNRSYSHWFANTENAEFSEFSANAVRGRGPGVASRISQSSIGQRESALGALTQLEGRDIFVQNMRFEANALANQVDPRHFSHWAENRANLESYSSYAGKLQTSTPKIRAAVSQATAAQNRSVGSLDNYLDAWGGVFKEFKGALEGPRPEGLTRAFDVQDLTKSVFAMAQKQNYMPKTGELWSGTSMETMSQAIFGQKELHAALPDAALQGEVTRFMYGAGLSLEAGEELTPGAAAIFKRLGASQASDKHASTVRRISETVDIQSRQAAGGILENAEYNRMRTDYKFKNRPPEVRQVRQPDGSYAEQKIPRGQGRNFKDPQISMNIDEVIGGWSQNAATQYGMTPDYDAARFEALGSRSARPLPSAIKPKAVAPPTVGEISDMASSTTKKVNWKMGVGIGLGILAANTLFSASDDNYNSIEGLRHGGFSGATRRYNTDFGSGYRGGLGGSGLNTSYDGRVTEREVISFKVEDADTVQVMLAGGNSIQLRLAGIDAPETEHGDAYASKKVFQKQPFGKRATQMLEELMNQQQKLTVAFNPVGQNTYGRTPALLMGDGGQNLNLRLVEMGAAASLPYGKASDRLASASAFNRAERAAVSSGAGMWGDPGWQAAHRIQMESKRRITHNSFTDLGKLYGNFKTSAIVHRLRNPDAQFSEMGAAGGRSDFNIIEGLKHGWAQSNREANIGDFGSGYIIDKTVRSVRTITRTSTVKRRLQMGQTRANTAARQMMDSQNWTNHQHG
jgi:endonuclease YncB( thermonuclease family)